MKKPRKNQKPSRPPPAPRSAQTGKPLLRRCIVTIEIESAGHEEQIVERVGTALRVNAIDPLTIGVVACKPVLRSAARKRLIELLEELREPARDRRGDLRAARTRRAKNSSR